VSSGAPVASLRGAVWGRPVRAAPAKALGPARETGGCPGSGALRWSSPVSRPMNPKGVEFVSRDGRSSGRGRALRPRPRVPRSARRGRACGRGRQAGERDPLNRNRKERTPGPLLELASEQRQVDQLRHRVPVGILREFTLTGAQAVRRSADPDAPLSACRRLSLVSWRRASETLRRRRLPTAGLVAMWRGLPRPRGSAPADHWHVDRTSRERPRLSTVVAPEAIYVGHHHRRPVPGDRCDLGRLAHLAVAVAIDRGDRDPRQVTGP
jgi:hypothetical protein